MNMKTIYLSIGAVMLIFLPQLVFGQAPPAPPATPIDGGLSLLLVGAAAYGIKKIRDRR